jgi:hypothetical protein
MRVSLNHKMLIASLSRALKIEATRISQGGTIKTSGLKSSVSWAISILKGRIASFQL